MQIYVKDRSELSRCSQRHSFCTVHHVSEDYCRVGCRICGGEVPRKGVASDGTFVSMSPSSLARRHRKHAFVRHICEPANTCTRTDSAAARGSRFDIVVAIGVGGPERGHTASSRVARVAPEQDDTAFSLLKPPTGASGTTDTDAAR